MAASALYAQPRADGAGDQANANTAFGCPANTTRERARLTTAVTATKSATTGAGGMLSRHPGVTIGRLRSSVRTRIVFGSIALLALAIAASIAVGRQILVQDLNRRIDSRLQVFGTEIRGISVRTPLRHGESGGRRARRIFAAFLRNNLPPRDGALLTFVDARLYQSSPSRTSALLAAQPGLRGLWADIPTPRRGSASSRYGPVEFLAVPLRTDAVTRGVFVALVFRDPARAELAQAVRASTLAGLLVLLLGSVAAWRLAGGFLLPIRALTRTADSITETDLSRRIQVAGDDEGAQLARTFNRMLDRLEAAFAAQRRLIDDAGHELRTPITIVRGHLELLGDDPDERGTTLALVDDELERMNRIVEDLLLLAKAQHPDFLRLDTLDLEAFTAELCAKAEAIAPRQWRCDGGARGIIVADRHRLTQAVIQLADNAARHTARGDTIAIGSAIEDGRAHVWVRDTGEGILAEEQERIFERFGRGANAQRLDGSGLGLSIVKAIAEAHHGSVSVESRPGAGATFTLMLPIDQPTI